MNILVGDDWRDGFLDYALGEGELRIEVEAYAPLLRIEGLYFTPPRQLRRLWNYLWEVGPIRLFYKVRSRLREGLRNQKFVACGIGTVIGHTSDSTRDLPIGSSVLFVAPTHPRCVERLSLPRALCMPLEPSIRSSVPEAHDEILFADLSENASDLPPQLRSVAGYSSHAGVPIETGDAQACLHAAREALESIPSTHWRRLARPREPIAESSAARDSSAAEGRPLRAVLYGYGHYAKTNILPNLPASIRCETIHELDPLQLGPARALPFRGDTSPWLRPGESYDVFFIASYHHTHAPLATAALRAGAWAVVEKPLVTRSRDLDALLEACAQTPGRFFAGFHKRYSRFNALSTADLGASDGDPISYYCIVFEVPLPASHWYRWPNSRSRLTSNGCHWIDHFLFLNGFPRILAAHSHQLPDGDVVCWMEAANGANFSMVLTDKGSNRIGLEEYVELRARNRKVTVVNNARYRAESNSRILRSARENKVAGYTRMYRTIAARISTGEPGDSIESIERSSRAVLLLEEGLAQGATR